MRRRRGFTLIELITYLTLLSTSLILLLSFEMASQKAAAEQRAALDIARSCDAFHERLRRDVLAARAIKVLGDGRLELRVGEELIRYQHDAKRRRLLRLAGEREEVYARILGVDFQLLPGRGSGGASLEAHVRAFQVMEVGAKGLVPQGPEWRWRFESLIGTWRKAP